MFLLKSLNALDLYNKWYIIISVYFANGLGDQGSVPGHVKPKT